jgi:hypothetical protein
MDIEKKDKKITWDTIVDSTKKYAKLAKEELVRSSKIGKVKIEITKLKRDKTNKIKELGEHCYKLLTEKNAVIEGADIFKTEINKLDAEIKKKEAEIAKIDKEEKK